MNKNNYLAHYGVMGMKWGVRRYQPYPKGQQVKGRFLGKTKTVSKEKLESMQNKHDKKSLKQLRKISKSVKKDTVMAPIRSVRKSNKNVNERVQKHFDEYNKKLEASKLTREERVATSNRILPELNQMGDFMRQAEYAKVAKDAYTNHHSKPKIDAILANAGPKVVSQYKKDYASTIKELDYIINRGVDAEKHISKKLKETSKNF